MTTVHLVVVVVKELQQREEIVAQKEATLAEKNELEIKKLRLSQATARVGVHTVWNEARRNSLLGVLEIL